MAETVRNMEVMLYEDIVEKAVAILTAPLPTVTGSRDHDRRERMDLAVKVLTGEVHPGDVTVPTVATINEQASSAFAGLSRFH